MKRTNNFTRRNVLVTAILMTILMSGAAFAQTTVFTYQGRFTDATVAQPTNGTYDLDFALYDAETGGAQIGAAVTISNVPVSNGVFTVRLDFGAAAFAAGANRFLQIAVRKTTEENFTTLTPRQPLTSSPYSIRTISANFSDALSENCVSCVTNEQINSVSGAKVTGAVANATTAANVSGVVAIANGGTGSATKNFVDLTTNQTIGGDKTFSNTVSGNVVNAVAQFNLGGIRILSGGGVNNLFAGAGAGVANASGQSNAFFGNSTGSNNTTGARNSFFGRYAGHFNDDGSDNAFFGNEAGTNNRTGSNNSFFGNGTGTFNVQGGNNSFFGRSAGATNGTGSNNTAIGSGADFTLGNLNYATAVGAGAKAGASNSVVLGRAEDTVNVPGDLNISGTLNAVLGQDAFTVYGNSGLTVTRTNQNYVLVPGLAQTIDVPANTFPRILISTDGGIRSNSTTSDGRSVVEVAIYVDGAIISSRQHHLSNASILPSINNWALSYAQLLTPGSHTIEVRARSSSESFLSNATVSGGGAGDSVLRGQLTVTIIKR